MATDAPCKFRILWKDPRGASIPPVYENDEAVTKNNSTDITKQPIVPYKKDVVYDKDDVIALSLYMRTAAVTALAVSSFNIPVTIQNTRTGVIAETNLSSQDFTGYNVGGTLPASIWTDWAYYTVPSGTRIVIGHKIPFNSRIYLAANVA